MKKVLSLTIVVILAMSLMMPSVVQAVDALDNFAYFTWAWGAKRIDADNEVKVVSWSGGSYSSYRSSFIVCDLPENFTYESVKSEVLISFAINSATLNNGEGQAPTAAVVLVNGDKVKEAYALKSGDTAAKILTDAKNDGIYFGKYKIGKYPRTSRIKDKEINEYFEKNSGVKSIGFYVTNIQSDGYSDMADGIASAMNDIEVNFKHYTNYTNAKVIMKKNTGEVLEEKSVRGEVGSSVDIPKTIEANGDIWARDTEEAVLLDENVDEIVITYHLDKGDREKYVEIIENEALRWAEEPLTENLYLPTEYEADDGFVMKIEWVSDNENVIGNDGSVYRGVEDQQAGIYAKIMVGEYTSINTEKIVFTVKAVEKGEVEKGIIYENSFDDEEGKRGDFEKTGFAIELDSVPENFTISFFVRCDDTEAGGNVFAIGALECDVALLNLTEGKWHHVAVTNNALYKDGTKIQDCELALTEKTGYIGQFAGKLDNFKVYDRILSKSVIESLCEEAYDSPLVEVAAAYVIEGLDGVIVKVSSHGYEGDGVISCYADENMVRNAGYSQKKIKEGLNIYSVSIPSMGGEAACDNVGIMLWDSTESMKPLTEKFAADRNYKFGFNYENPDNHMLSNTFTLKNAETGKYLEIDGEKELTAPFEAVEGYHVLKSIDGKYIDGDWSFAVCDGDLYSIVNKRSGNYLAMTGSSVHEKAVFDDSCKWDLDIIRLDIVSRIFISEGFFALSENERERLYGGTAQALYNSRARRDKLIESVSTDYFDLDGELQAEILRKVFDYSPSYQINMPVNYNTTGYEAEYSLSQITCASYTGMYDAQKTGYYAKAVYRHEEGEREVEIYARSHNVIRNIAKGLSYMPYQFVSPLKRVVDYYDNANQFKAETGEIYILTNYEVSVDNFAVTGAHELGHIVDFAGFRISVGEAYKKSLEGDCFVLSGYADTARSEDFAEFCQFVISCSGDREKLRQLREMFPGRYDALCEGMCEMYGECILK